MSPAIDDSRPTSIGDAAQIRRIIEQTVMAVEESRGVRDDYVTRDEMERAMEKMEQRLEIRLENAILKTRNWILGGIIAVVIMFGGGFLSMMSRFDRVADAVGTMQVSLDQRREWINEQNERDRHQDDSLLEVDPDYVPIPFEENPR